MLGYISNAVPACSCRKLGHGMRMLRPSRWYQGRRLHSSCVPRFSAATLQHRDRALQLYMFVRAPAFSHFGGSFQASRRTQLHLVCESSAHAISNRAMTSSNRVHSQLRRAVETWEALGAESVDASIRQNVEKSWRNHCRGGIKIPALMPSSWRCLQQLRAPEPASAAAVPPPPRGSPGPCRQRPSRARPCGAAAPAASAG